MNSSSTSAPPCNPQTYQPSAEPTCAGYLPGHDGDSCNACVPGTFSSNLGDNCVPCKTGTYSNEPNSTMCILCSYPHYTVGSGSTDCSVLSLHFPLWCIIVIVVLFSLVSIVGWKFAGEHRGAFVLNMLAPLADLVTDVVYVTSSVFVNPLLFLVGVLCMFLPSVAFISDLLINGVMPGMWLPPIVILSLKDNVWPPLFMGTEIRFLFKDPNRLEWLLWNFLVLVFLFVLQLLMPLIVFLWMCCYCVFLVIWLLLACIMHETHVMCIGDVRIFWHGLWSGEGRNTVNVDMNDVVEIDTFILNRSLYWGFVLDEVPLLCIQFVNNYYIYGSVNNWSTFQIISSVLSIYSAASSAWKYLYFHYIKQMEWCDIPISVSRSKMFHVPPKSGICWQMQYTICAVHPATSIVELYNDSFENYASDCGDQKHNKKHLELDNFIGSSSSL